MSATRSTLVVSLRSRGLASLQYGKFFSFREHFVNLVLAVVDIFTSAINTFTCMSWNAWIALSICLIVAGNATQSDSVSLPDTALFLPFFAFVILPCLMMLGWAVLRRDRAVLAIGRVKVLVTSLLLQASSLVPASDSTNAAAAASGAVNSSMQVRVHEGAADPRKQSADAAASGQAMMRRSPPGSVAAAAEDQRITLLALLDDLHAYLAHNRPYARHFFLPYLTAEPTRSETLYAVSRQMGALLRKLHLSLRQLHINTGCLCEVVILQQNMPIMMTAPAPAPSAAPAAASGKPSSGAAFDPTRNSAAGGLAAAPSILRQSLEGAGTTRAAAGAGAGGEGAAAGNEAADAHSGSAGSGGTQGAAGTAGAGTGAAAPAGLGQAQRASAADNAAVAAAVLAAHTAVHAAGHIARMPRLRGAAIQAHMIQQEVQQLHMAVEELSGIKETRTPMLLRAMQRWYTVVIIPVIIGLYFLGAAIRDNDAMGVFLAALAQFSLMVLVDVCVALEDPFDERALDALSLLEVLDHVAVMASDDETLNPSPDGEALPVNGLPNSSAAANSLYALAGAATPWGAPADDPSQQAALKSARQRAALSYASPPMPPPPTGVESHAML